MRTNGVIIKYKQPFRRGIKIKKEIVNMDRCKKIDVLIVDFLENLKK